MMRPALPAADGVAALGLALPKRTAPHIVGVFPGAGHPSVERLAASLAAADICISVRSGALRISVHVYNSLADVERLLQALSAAVSGDGARA